MSVTFSGGITFTGGGFSFTEAPPAQGTAGWITGGSTEPATTSMVQRITFATDTAYASVRGPLSAGKYAGAGFGNFTYGWIVGGVNYSISPSGAVTTIDRITYATDTATASSRGNTLYALRAGQAGAGDVTAGWFSGGFYAPVPTLFQYWPYPQKITYATDTATASQKGDLSVGIRSATAVTDGNTYGTTYCWVVGGLSSTGEVSLVQRITYANDTGTASIRGSLSSPQAYLGGVNNTTYGWVAGGGAGGPYLSTVQRITYATDTATASIRGPIYIGTYQAGSGNADYGWFSGGRYPPGNPSFLYYVYRIEYATDTATASARGNLNTGVTQAQSTSGIQ